MPTLAVVCNDTRGGVQPYAALCIELKKAGFNLKVVCPAHSTSLFTDNEIDVTSELGTRQEFLEASRKIAEANVWEKIAMHREGIGTRDAVWADTIFDACSKADLILTGLGGLKYATRAGKLLNRPVIQLHLQPIFSPSNLYPGVLVPEMERWIKPFGISVSHVVTDALVKSLAGVDGLNTRYPNFFGFSKRVVPIQDFPNIKRVAHGYWTLPDAATYSPPKDLTDFLRKEDNVICVGFGSMVSQDPRKVFATVEKGIRATGYRALILTGWNDLPLDNQDDAVFYAPDVPHSWLFPRVAGVVHHGGAGTTGAALLAGKPQLLVPFGMEQMFWASRANALGVSVAPIKRAALTSMVLKDSLKGLMEDKVVASARELGALLRSENGVSETVADLKKLL